MSKTRKSAMVCTTRELTIRLENGKLELYENGTLLNDHDFEVLAGHCGVYIFKIPYTGDEEHLVFAHSSDGTNPAVTWNNPNGCPESVQQTGPEDPYKLLALTVSNPPDRPKVLVSSFTFNLCNEGVETSMGARAFQLDPTIIEKPDEPISP